MTAKNRRAPADTRDAAEITKGNVRSVDLCARRAQARRSGLEHAGVIIERIWWGLLLRWETSRVSQ